ncbi:MAG: tail-specific protease [Desulfuromonas sp.]|nr:MAG: tail-specific protease [Desulfuromonas sp.]
MNRYLNLLEDEQQESEVTDGADDAEVEESPEALRIKAREKVRKSFEDFFSRLQKDEGKDHVDRYFDAVARAFDPHTNYLPPRQKEDFDISMRGSLEGIGATLREEDGYIKVVSIIPGSAASRQGQLHAEDIIVMVAQGQEEPVDITDTRLRDAVSLIRGKKGTEVRLTVKHPDGTRAVIAIVRDVVQIEETFAKGLTIEDEETGERVGYIKIPTFYRDFSGTQNGGTGRNVTDDVQAELKKMMGEGIEGLILDLRNNGGGALTDAVSITGLFIKSGPVVQVKQSDGKIKVLKDRDPTIVYDGPLVVLVNKFSASASEILAGALQDYGRAVVIGGEHTHGKGTVQSMIDLNRSVPFPNMVKYKPLGAMKVTIQKFYRVSGESTQYRGIVPDIVLPDTMQHVKSGEKFLDFSLPWDTVDPTEYTPWQLPAQALSAVKARSIERVKESEDFVTIAKEAEEAKARREKTLQPLQFEEVKKEREEVKAKRAKKNPGMHGHGADEGDEKKNAELSEQEKRDQWLADIQEDPYAQEAISVLDDLDNLLSSKPLVKEGVPEEHRAVVN